MPLKFIHGSLKGYRVEYRIIKVGYEWKQNYPINVLMVNPFYIRTTINNLMPNAVYEIKIMAENEHGIGVESNTIYGGKIFAL